MKADKSETTAETTWLRFFSREGIKNLIGADSIFLGEYPYTYVRVLYLLAELIKKEDYHKLLKMSLPEITKYLEESGYKEEIDRLAVKYSGTALLENAFHLNTVKSFEKLKRISSEKIRIILEGYFKKIDVYNLKTIIRGKFTNMPEEQIKELILPIGKFDSELLSEVLKKDSIKEILLESGIVDSKLADKVFGDFKKTNNLIELENVLDKEYYRFILLFSRRIKSRDKKFREFLESEIYITNLLTILRLKKVNAEKSNILKYLIFTGNKKKDLELNNLAELDSIGRVISAIQKYDKDLYSQLAAIKDENLVGLEIALKRFLIKKTLQFRNKYPLSMDIIFGYLLGKEMEIRNLSLIVKGKKLGMDNKFIEEQIVA